MLTQGQKNLLFDLVTDLARPWGISTGLAFASMAKHCTFPGGEPPPDLYEFMEYLGRMKVGHIETLAEIAISDLVCANALRS